LSETKSIVANKEMAEQDYPIQMYYYLTLKFKQMNCATAQKPHRQLLPAVALDLLVTSCHTLAWLLTKTGSAFPLGFSEEDQVTVLNLFKSFYKKLTN
jgi:hypothetical protein